MTAWAIDRLRDTGEPFFLMIEAGKPDHAAHENWALTLLDEMESYDAAIGLAMDRLDPGTTLLLATSDHETGGLAINGYPAESDGILGTYAPEKGAPYAVLSFATGPGKDAVKGAPHGAADPRSSGVIETDAAHTGVDVILYAWGAGSERVHGTLENTAVHDILKDYLSGAPPAGSNQR
jgi:alkaline phosphatase